jgi:hypothetical protein
MKKESICFLVVAFLLTTCKKDPSNLSVPIYMPCEVEGWELVTMKKNDLSMEASVLAAKCAGDTNRIVIFLAACDSNGVLSEYFVLSCFEKHPGVYNLCRVNNQDCMHHADYYTTYYDQPEDDYYLDESKNNFLEITESDTLGKWIEGKFDMYFIHDKERRPKQNEANPDRVRFSEGRFRTRLP